eukprot:CAMPEP_0204643850 /NCGR_PEP_ID=MMETSP0718-20130828/1020_1 /ASSEMBLY_ACC=CAM_ASM_000674 /TAXON_ID=230516 /ORGANISM="Chaetoceros curvisetus" /LENGTH=87 /DNA_ID=CAMNT_0051665195 /DNA_START=61 /DNA_END=324 /DNA_ORIENTATION=+
MELQAALPNLIAHHNKSSIMMNAIWACREDKDDPSEKAEMWRDDNEDPLRIWVKCNEYLVNGITKQSFWLFAIKCPPYLRPERRHIF